MRSLFSDTCYFEFLDDLRGSGAIDFVHASSALVREFPTLRREEAKAICTDWRMAHRHSEAQ